MGLREFLNESSKSVIAYHGGASFDKFDNSMIGSAGNELVFGQGFYFTSDEEMAMDFAVRTGYFYKVKLSFKNPYITDTKDIMTNPDPDRYLAELRKKHDGLIIKNRKFGGGMKFPNKRENFTEYVVYDKNVIKILEKRKVQ